MTAPPRPNDGMRLVYEIEDGDAPPPGGPHPAIPPKTRVTDCPFCDYAGPSEVLARRDGAFIIEPINPVCEGHVLVIPTAHVADFATVSVGGVGRQVALLLAADWARDKGGDWNLITSKGKAATQTVAHLHFHLVPRREGDGLALPWSPPHKATAELEAA